MADRTASAVWNGDLFTGSGTVSATSSRLFTDAPVTWAARTESPGATTSPEELLAAAHASCFCMALSNELSSRGRPPALLAVNATATFEDGTITRMALEVAAEVPGDASDVLVEALHAAEQSCPVSNALRNNVVIDVTTSPG